MNVYKFRQAMNQAAPSLKRDELADVINDLIATVNSLVTFANALAAKLDSDAGVTGTDYASTLTTQVAVDTIASR